MKKLFTIILTISVFLSFAQAPQGINYQGVARDANGVLSQSTIAVGFKILNSSSTPVFTETHPTINTNQFGLFTLVIGSVNTTGFSSINWGTSTYFIEVSINGQLLGTQQLMSVPYALYAEKAGNSAPTPTIIINSPNTATMSLAGVYSINVPTSVSNTYSLIQSANTASLIQNGTTNVGVINLPISASSSVVAGNNNINVTQSGNTYSVSAPSYSITGTNSNTIVLSNGVNSSTVVIPVSTTPQTSIISTNNNVTITPTGTNSFVINAYSYTLASNSNSITIGNGLGGTSNTVAVPTYSLAQTSNTLITLYQNGSSVGTATLATNTGSVTNLTASTNVTVTGTVPNYTISSPSYSLSFPSYSLATINNGTPYTATIASTPVSYTNNVLTIGSTTVSIPALWQENSGVVSPVTLANNLGVGTTTTSGDKMQINFNSVSTPTNNPFSHLHIKQTVSGDNFSRIKFTNDAVPNKFWLNSVTNNATDANSGYNFFYYNGTKGHNLFTVAGDGKVSVNPFSTHTNALFSTKGGVDLDSVLQFFPPLSTPPNSSSGNGKIYFDPSINKFMISENGSIYKPLLSGTPWLQNTGYVTLANVSDNVGIGTSTPTNKLEISANSSVNGLQINNTGSGGGINVVTSSSSVASIFVKNDNTSASIFANKLAGTGYVARFENQNTNNSLSTIYATTNSTSSLTAVAEFANTGIGSAINASSNYSMMATINAKNNGGGPSANFTGDVITHGTLVMDDGNQAIGKIMVSDANGKSSWKTSPPTIYFGSLNAISTTVSATPAPLGTAVMNITKLYGNSEIVIDVNTMLYTGTGITTSLYIQVFVDGVTSPLSSKYITGTVPGTNEYVSLHSVFQGLSAGSHNITINAYTGTGSRTGVLVDSGGYGGILTVKEQL